MNQLASWMTSLLRRSIPAIVLAGVVLAQPPASLPPIPSDGLEVLPRPTGVAITQPPVQAAPMPMSPLLPYPDVPGRPRTPEREREELPVPRTAPATPAPAATTSSAPQSPPGFVGVQLSGKPLALAQVLTSVDRHYPAVMAAEQERIVAAGRLQAATGAFDLNLTAGQYLQDGSYPSNRSFVGFNQPTPFLGATVFGGYRLGNNKFPEYYGDRLTAEGGEFRAGVSVPLLRDRDTDRRRAGVTSAAVDRALAEPNIHLQRVDVARSASRAYWAWVTAGQRYHIATEVMNIARQRDAQLAARVQAGNLAPIERVENQRIFYERAALVEQAARTYQNAAITLSLFLRDDRGQPLLPDPRDVPWFQEPMGLPNAGQRAADLDIAYQQRPELARLGLQREKLLVDLRLAENQTLPGVNFSLIGAQDVGAGKKTLDRATYEAALLVDVPLQRRDARGRILALQGQIAQIGHQEQLARDRVYAEVTDALSALEQAYRTRIQARKNLDLAREVEDGERALFRDGKSDLFRVNIRELQRAEAQTREIDALSEFYRALADYNAALGLDLSRATRE